MAGGRTPVNQLDALPLISAATWVNGSGPTQQTLTGAVLKYWSATAVGISGATAALVGTTAYGNAGNLIDLSGCSLYTMVLTKTIASAGAEVATVPLLYFQGTPVGVAFPTITDAFYDIGLGQIGFGIASFTMTGWAFKGSGYPYTRIVTRGFSNANPIGSTPLPATSAQGPMVGAVGRFILITANPATDSSTWSLELWGQTL